MPMMLMFSAVPCAYPEMRLRRFMRHSQPLFFPLAAGEASVKLFGLVLIVGWGRA